MKQATIYKGRKLDKDRAIYSLSKKGCVVGPVFIDLKKARNLGNKSFGLIDFLVNYHGLIVTFREYKIKI